MGCAQSTPTSDLQSTTSAREHKRDRTKDSSQHGPQLWVGEHYTQVKHLGTWLVMVRAMVMASHWDRSSFAFLVLKRLVEVKVKTGG